MSIHNTKKYTWEELHNDVESIASRCKDLHFKPEGVVGIVRGGAVPAIILSHIFNCPVHLVDYSLRDGKDTDFKKIDQIAIAASHGKKFLIVDDIVDSGATLSQVKERLFDTKNNILYTSLWYNPSQTNVSIHIWSRVIDRSIDDSWIIFPYENNRKV